MVQRRFLLLLCLLIWGAQLGQAQAPRLAHNVIYMIGDGMGFQQLAMARLVKGAPLVMDSMAVKSEARNASENDQVTDSAAAGTAHATGYRTNNGMVAMTPTGKPLDSIVRLAKKDGMATGVVTRDALHGATPGAYIANAMDRDEKNTILEQAIFQTQPDVLMGGGQTVFGQIGAAGRLNQTDYQLVQNRSQLMAWDTNSGKKLLGIFGSSAMSYEVDRPATEPDLAEMVKVALNTLSKDEDGFFLMVEGARIDTAGHSNDLRRNVSETMEFDEAIAVALAFAAERSDTLVIVTADHETGGLTPGAGTPSVDVIRDGPAAVRAKIADELAKDPQASLVGLLNKYGISDVSSYVYQGNFNGFLESLLQRGSAYYTTTGHTGVPIPAFAQGPGAERFTGEQHIADMGQDIMAILGLNPGL